MSYTISDKDIIGGIIDLSRKEIHSIELGDDLMASSVKQLCVDYNELEEIPPDISILKCLTILSVIGNDLTFLPPEVGDLDFLEHFILNENSLSSLPASICNLRCLKIFSAIGNCISMLPEGFFSSFQGLTEVYLNENNIEILPEKICELESLRVLEADQNHLTSLPRDLGKMTGLEILSAQDNELSSLPASIKDLKNIRILNLSNNRIKELPEAFGSESKLERLYLNDNMIKVLPQWVSNLPHIEVIQMNDNKLVKMAITYEFCNTNTKLKALKLGSNFLESLPDNFGQLKDLSVIHLGSTMCELERRAFQNGNWMTSLPDSFTELTMLTKCHLDENQLQKLPENFGQLVNLKWLDLGQNRLREIPDSFCNLRALEYLQLAKNPLMKLPDNFGALTELNELRMESTNVSELPESFFKLTNLRVLDLFHNKLTQIPFQLFKLKQLIRLDLDQNLFDLNLADIPHLIPTNNYPSRDPNLHDNWRGKPRAGMVKIEATIIPSEDNGSEPETNCDIDWSTIETDTTIFVNAVRQGKSIWRSHGASDQRTKSSSTFNTISSMDSHLKEKNLLTESDDEYEPVIHQIDDITTLKKNKLNKAPVVRSEVCFESEEDWDAECANDVSPSCFKETIYYPSMTNNGVSLNSYPCAEQAKSTTVPYESLQHHFFRMTLNTERPKYPPPLPSVFGQFDDAE